MKKPSETLSPWARLRSWVKRKKAVSRKQELDCIIDACEKHINKKQFQLTDNEKMVVVSQLYDKIWNARTVRGDVDEYERLLGYKQTS